MKKLVTLLLGGTLLYSFANKQTDGFRLSAITQPPPPYGVSIQPSLIEKNALDQPYFYLSHGAQVFAFVSQDGSHVIKFYRNNRASHPLWPVAHLLPHPWKVRLHQTVAKREAKRKKDFNSFKISAEELAEDTGLFYLHLTTTSHLKKKLTFYDKIGVRHQIDLDRNAFILQKKADPFYPTLKSWIDHGEIETAKVALYELVTLLKRRIGKKIADKDPNLATNFGFVNNRPIQIDIGRFRPSIHPASSTEENLEIRRITDHLRKWLENQEPELATYLEEHLEI